MYRIPEEEGRGRRRGGEKEEEMEVEGGWRRWSWWKKKRMRMLSEESAKYSGSLCEAEEVKEKLSMHSWSVLLTTPTSQIDHTHSPS